MGCAQCQKKLWTVKDTMFPVYSGVLATAAIWSSTAPWTAGSAPSMRITERSSGNLKPPSGIIGDPMTFIGPDGKQYVAIYSGIGGWMGASALPSVSTDDPYAALGPMAPCATSRPIPSQETRCMSSATKLGLSDATRAAAGRAAGHHGVSQPRCAAAPRLRRPHNLPYSNQQQQGFENRMADMIARDLGMQVSYVWYPQRAKFFRKTLDAGICDVVMGVPAGMDEAITPAPTIFRATCFSRAATGHLAHRSFDDPRLQRLRIGVQALGPDEQRAARSSAGGSGMLPNICWYIWTYRTYITPNQPSALIDAVERGDVDLAVAWGPLAGYFAQAGARALEHTPVSPSRTQCAVRFRYFDGRAAGRSPAGGATERDFQRRGARARSGKLLQR